MKRFERIRYEKKSYENYFMTNGVMGKELGKVIGGKKGVWVLKAKG